ncbi:PhnD/SsuA/transferrin family substrate-binding protein [Devosia naphthalenivorans]|uniref:substrate-binding domain-containing protein n=1 Tax=Devosia naphthalenivorans TaxID=2082392 RepID=UPI002481B0E7|nr:PhnD/SsuA/transferrin family substrate-binding protein [Devosia naphthalenivorans]
MHRLLTRRGFVAGAVAAAFSTKALAQTRPDVLRFGLTPVFLSDDLALLDELKRYLEQSCGRPVQLVTRRTYQEIVALLVSGQLEAAWICGYPFVQFRSKLSLVAVPVWRGKSLYQSYLIVAKDRSVATVAELKGDVHAFSDPDSNSGYLVTSALLAGLASSPARYFSHTFFTYAHRNVVRAVASGLAQSGSVDGYVLEVLKQVEPTLVEQVRIVRRSEWLGFPPIACAAGLEQDERVLALGQALYRMHASGAGQRLLSALQLDGFVEQPPSLYDPISLMVAAVSRSA